MLRSAGIRLWRTSRRGRAAAFVATTGAAVAAGTGYYAATSDETLGLRRQASFWLRVTPIMADYYWQFGSRSPYVQYLKWNLKTDDNDNNNSVYQADKEQRKQQLHERHAPEILQVMLDLKGLYVKLGQVLSVTALPLPEQYRERFRTLQSDVPGHEEFAMVQAVLKRELQVDDLSTLFESIQETPEGAASIGQAHRAVLKAAADGGEREVIVKVQYPDAAWQVPADIQCVGDLLKICVYAGIVDESAANMSFSEFARQFLSELDYEAEQRNLRETYQSTLLAEAPYRKRGVLVPQVYEELSSSKVITMSYLKGPKLEEEALRQLELLGIDTKKGIGSIVRDAARDASKAGDEMDEDTVVSEATLSSQKNSWKVRWGKRVGQWVGVDNAFSVLRWTRRMLLWSTAVAASTVGLAAPLLPASWKEWSDSHVTAYEQAQRLALTKSWIDALFDVHGYQIFQQGLFNADCHPGNILVVEDDEGATTKLGLIDYGQCKRMTPTEQVKVAELLLSVANKESDDRVAAAFRRLGVQSKNDSTEFLAEMAHLMFGRFETQHLNHAYHQRLHKMDRITYFPKELSMVYRTSLLLRGLAVSLQVNASVSEQWRSHAQAAVDKHGASVVQKQETQQIVEQHGSSSFSEPPLAVREVAVGG